MVFQYVDSGFIKQGLTSYSTNFIHKAFLCSRIKMRLGKDNKDIQIIKHEHGEYIYD